MDLATGLSIPIKFQIKILYLTELKLT